MTEPTHGILLAGGLARRMGGGDKPLMSIGGKTIVGRAIETLTPQCQGILISANGDPARYGSFGLPVVADDVPGFAGPLAGILAGLDWIAAHCPTLAWAVSVAGDTPFIPDSLVSRLHEARERDGTDLACAMSGGRTHPTTALWPVALRRDLRHALVHEDIRKIDRFTGRYTVSHAEWSTELFDPFFNVNEPDDLVAAEAILRFRADGNEAATHVPAPRRFDP